MPDDDSDNEVAIEGSAPVVSSNDPTIREVLELEKRRIDRDNRRSTAMEKMLELAEAQDQRAFEFATASRDAENKLRGDREVFLRKLWVLLTAFAIILLGYSAWFSSATRISVRPPGRSPNL